jgi:hypothetical protein
MTAHMFAYYAPALSFLSFLGWIIGAVVTFPSWNTLNLLDPYAAPYRQKCKLCVVMACQNQLNRQELKTMPILRRVCLNGVYISLEFHSSPSHYLSYYLPGSTLFGLLLQR